MTDIKDVIKKVVSYNDNKPIDSYKLNYQAMQNQLEPTYYWVLDFMTPMFDKIEKITDNFTSSPGSGHFVEMSQRATRMQEEGIKIMGTLNQIIKSVLNLIYDLKDFKQRLKNYDDAKSNNKSLKDSAELALKQVWLDSVDVSKRQAGSIHNMTAQLGYTTLRDAFMVANSVEDIKKMANDDEGLINKTVMRVLIPRFQEYLDWKVFSEKELRKRFNIEKSYLKSQIETIKLYSSWVQPYLKAAEELRQKGFDNHAALVSAFSTSMFELVLMATKEVKSPLENYSGRKYYALVVVNFKYRGHVMQKVTQRGDFGPAFEGKVDMSFDSYAVNEDELKLIYNELEKERLGDTLTFNSNIAEEALIEIKEDLEEFLNEKDEEDVKPKKKKEDDINPFSALFKPFFSDKKVKEKKKQKEIKELKDVPKESWVEKQARVEAANKATSTLYKIYDIYKKAHGMASSPEPFAITESFEPDTELKDLFDKFKK